jgi:DNA-binding SARP family transcriptional activator
MLLIHANEVVSTDALIDALWMGPPPPSALLSLEVHVSRLRRAFLDAAATHPPVITTSPCGYRLNAEDQQTDIGRFERLALEGHEYLLAGDVAESCSLLSQSLELWRGPALVEFSRFGFAQPEIARLESRRLEALEDRIEADLALGHEWHIASELEGLVKEHPLRERFHAQLMLALTRCGRQADALAVYNQLRARLGDELGVDPGASIEELYIAILRRDPRIEPPTAGDQKIASR